MKFSVDEQYIDARLDFYISDLNSEKISRSYAKSLIENNHVTVNGKQLKPSYKLKLNDLVEIDLPEPTHIQVVPEDIPLSVIYEDDDLIVIDKPVNMITHPAPGVYSGTLVNAVLGHLLKSNPDPRTALSDINGVLRPGIVHRLDKDTSGLIVVAKNNPAHQALALQLQDRTCKRIYNAISYENIKEDQVTINRPIARHPIDRHKMTGFDRMSPQNSAREARTHFKVLERFNYRSQRFTLVECSLDTGRTHQIRVHLSWMKRPIIGDYTYGAPDKLTFKVSRPMLHALELSFVHPRTKQACSFKTGLAEDFARILSILRAS